MNRKQHLLVGMIHDSESCKRVVHALQSDVYLPNDIWASIYANPHYPTPNMQHIRSGKNTQYYFELDGFKVWRLSE